MVVERALALLDDSADPTLVNVYCESARLQLAFEESRNCFEHRGRAQTLAERLGDAPSQIGALQTVGWVEFFSGAPGGLEKLVESLELSTEVG